MNTLDHALQYAAKGWHVFPLQPGSKIPYGDSGAHHDATIDANKITEFWSTVPDANIGISIRPSGLCVLDVDTADGKLGAESLREIGDRLPQTLIARTGRGGLHVVYKCGDLTPRRVIGFEPGLDLLGEGYIVAAPSKLPGGSYAWINDRDIAPPPSYFGEVHARKPSIVATSQEGADILHGGRSNAFYRLGAALRDQGIGEDALVAALMAENIRRCNPPMKEHEVCAIAASVMTRVTPARDAAGGAVFASALGITAPDNAKPEPAGAVLASDFAEIEPHPVRVYSSGIPQLDVAMGGGIQTRGISVIIGPPAAGKTGHVLGIAKSCAAASGVPSLYVSTELERSECVARLAALETGDAHRDMLRGKIPRERIKGAVAGTNVYLLGVEARIRGFEGLQKLQSEIETIKAAHGTPPVVFIDYLQMLALSFEGDAMRLGVSTLIYGIHLLSLECDCAIVVVSATARSGYKPQDDDDPIAYLSTAKESGDIEYAATVVTYLDVDHEKVDDHRAARVVVAKARFGEPGFIGAKFHGASGKWKPCAESAQKLSSTERKRKQATEDESADDAKVLQIVSDRGPCVWREVRSIGGGAARMDRARDRLIESGQIVAVEDVQLNSLGRSRKRTLLCIPGREPAKAVPDPIVEGAIATNFLK